MKSLNFSRRTSSHNNFLSLFWRKRGLFVILIVALTTVLLLRSSQLVHISETPSRQITRTSPLHEQWGDLVRRYQPSDSSLSSIDDKFLRRHIKEMSDDKYKGRGTGSKGEIAAIEYLESNMLQLHPSVQILRQSVPLMGVTAIENPKLVFSTPKGIYSFDFTRDFIAFSETPEQTLSIESESLIFIGYGIHSNFYKWDDYKGIDVSGKIVLCLVNEPYEPSSDLFKGKELTYYGRWMYKIEEARKHNVRGIIFIHTVETAGYPFTVLSGQKEQIVLQDPPENPIDLRAWITEPTARKLAELTGESLDRWLEEANSPSFTPRVLTVDFSVTVEYELRGFTGQNVIATITGSSKPNEYVIYSAHHDHLGEGDPDKSGDSIYNGAQDNASGLAMLLATIQSFGQMKAPLARSVAFITFTGEEAGLLGSLYYVRNPIIPIAQSVANINYDIGNIYGKTKDIVGLGADKSDLDGLFSTVAEAEGLEVSKDPRPEQGSFFRADSFAFAKVGVPSIYPWMGKKFVGKEDDYYIRVRDHYVHNNYHMPSDEYSDDFLMEGVIQQVRVGVRLGVVLANSSVRPQYYKDELESFL